MFELSNYFFIIMNLASGLLSLLGAVGIFISLIIQRRVSQLQDILEELLDLSYDEGTNNTVKIQNLIYKYQMQYMLPVKPIKTVISYINLNIALEVLFWIWLLYLTYRSPFQWDSLIYLWPMAAILAVMIFYRQLIKSTINPVDNHMFNSIIPSPRYLRSIAFLSSYVNVSVGTIIRQARPTPALRKKGPASWHVILKEELPFDDYHYYFCLTDQEQVYFSAFGHILIELDADPITGKPRPTARNLNIPLGEITQDQPFFKPEASLLIFPKGEKHPMEFSYDLEQASNVYYALGSPRVSVNHLITYNFEEKNTLNILSTEAKEKKLEALPAKINSGGSRWYCVDGERELVEAEIKPYID
ncbi:hypothetical protein [Candidatus Formimonas warabiya]|uniref:Uncharacterized protein n=1 Tax=Formimonas warabiya TaxID=1761012 RepID=A0A3G1KM20_FORW1|nr:hypothetical protein [Candidatus Formimonas warabiya]ATW23492.1 hypothetical protein DCMF_00595 [Candidatus Formimonas warabiya]